MKNKLVFWGIMNSLGTFAYITLVALFFSNVERLFGNKPDNVLAPMAMLLLFVLSASITGGLVLGRPVYMYFGGQKAEAVKLFLYTIGCLFVIMIIVFLGFVLVK